MPLISELLCVKATTETNVTIHITTLNPPKSDLGTEVIKAKYVRLLVFTFKKIQVKIFCVVTPCSVMLRHQCFRGPCCLP